MGGQTEVLYGMRHWPVWGQERVRQTLLQIMALLEGRMPLEQTVQQGQIKGGAALVAQLRDLLDTFSPHVPLASAVRGGMTK